MTDQNAIISNLEITHRKKPQYSEEQRKKHYQGYQASKLSIEKYCELHKISQSALRKWIKKFQLNLFSNGIRLRFPELIDPVVIKQLIKELSACN